MKRIRQSVSQSTENLTKEQPEDCTIKFTSPKPAHEDILNSIINKSKTNPNSTSASVSYTEKEEKKIVIESP